MNYSENIDSSGSIKCNLPIWLLNIGLIYAITTAYYFFMNNTTFDTVELEKAALDGAELFLQDGDKVLLQEYNGNPINVNLEPSCTLEVEDTPPGEKGDTATGGKKPATMTTGLTIQVPLFIKIGDKLVIDTRTKEYRSRT